MATSEYYKKLRSQSTLAVHQVQPLLEQLTCELALSRPSDPVAAMIVRLTEMEAEHRAGEVTTTTTFKVVAPRRVVSILGCPYAGKTAQSAMAAVASHGIVLSPSELLEEAINGGRSKKGDHENIPIPAQLQQDIMAAVRAASPVPTPLLTALFVNRIHVAEAAAEAELARGAAGFRPKDTFFLDGYPRTIEQALELEAVLGEVHRVVYVDCPKAVAMERMTAAGVSPEAQEQRWRQFCAATIPLVEFWKAKKKLFAVDGAVDRKACGDSVKELVQE